MQGLLLRCLIYISLVFAGFYLGQSVAALCVGVTTPHSQGALVGGR